MTNGWKLAFEPGDDSSILSIRASLGSCASGKLLACHAIEAGSIPVGPANLGATGQRLVALLVNLVVVPGLCPVLLAARQPDSQSGNIGSIPIRDAKYRLEVSSASPNCHSQTWTFKNRKRNRTGAPDLL